MKTQRGTDGFTLIELLIVVVIIGILAAIAIPKFQAVRMKGYRSAMMADLRNVASSQEIYYNGSFTFSSDLTALQASTTDGVTVTVGEATNTGWSATATHVAIPGETCAIYHGTAAPVDPATVESMVACSF